MRETYYISVDIEANGRIPGRSSMLSLGAVAFNKDGEEIGAFNCNLTELPDSEADPEVAEWWQRFPDQYRITRQNLELPEHAMPKFEEFIQATVAPEGSAICMAHPASYDFLWLDWYCRMYLSRNPFGHACLCIKTLVMAYMGVDFERASKSNFPVELKELGGANHTAIDDARYQGRVAMRILSNLNGISIKGV